MRAKTRWLSVAFMVCIIAVFLAWHCLAPPPAAISFETAQELHVFACASGLHTCNDGRYDSSTFFIADHPITSEDIAALLTRRDSGLTPRWRGIVCAAQIRTPGYFLDPEQGFGGHWRVWGNVIVAGDLQLMDRLEELSRNR
jgi:hypothetical protein